MNVVRASRLLAVQNKPASSKSVGLKLLLGNAFIHPAGRGLFSLLPLGQRVVDKLVRIIDAELDALGAQKVAVPALGAKEVWEKSGRWDSMGAELLKIKDRLGKEFCLQPTAEEIMTEIVAHHSKLPSSTFPLLLYQTTEKFRDEMNPRFGLVRGKQFIMNDMYSFDLTKEGSSKTYEEVCFSYDRIFREKLGLEVYKVAADGSAHGGRVSHEYHMLNALEEDALLRCNSCGTFYKADEKSEFCCEGAKNSRISSIEVAHTFELGDKFSVPYGLVYGKNSLPLQMCCFGIGVTRLLPAIIEFLARGECVDEPILRLPVSIQPFDVSVVVTKSLGSSSVLSEILSALSTLFSGQRATILLDDRYEWTIGRRVKYAEQIGLSTVIVLGRQTEKTADSGPLYELWSSAPLEGVPLLKKGDFDCSELLNLVRKERHLC